MGLRSLSLASAIVAALVGGSAYAQQTAALRVDQPVSGNLTERARHMLYRYRGTPGERIRVALDSGDFDAYLTIGRPGDSNPENCSGCLSNDDGGSGTNSLQRYTVPEGGEVEIRVASLGDNGTGRYTVRLTQLPPAAPPEVRPLTVGSTQRGNLSERSSEDDSGRPFDIWSIRGEPGQELVVRMESNDFDTVLQYGRYEGSNFESQQEDDDGGSGTNSRLRITLDGRGQGAVRALSFGEGNLGSYTISLAPRPQPQPIRAQDLAVGDSVSGKLEAGDSFDPDDEDTFFDVYQIKGRPGQRVTIQLNATNFDALLRWGVFDGETFIEDSRDDDGGGGTNSRLTVTLDADGKGRLLVTALGQGEGQYTLSAVNAVRSSR